MKATKWRYRSAGNNSEYSGTVVNAVSAGSGNATMVNSRTQCKSGSVASGQRAATSGRYYTPPRYAPSSPPRRHAVFTAAAIRHMHAFSPATNQRAGATTPDKTGREARFYAVTRRASNARCRFSRYLLCCALSPCAVSDEPHDMESREDRQNYTRQQWSGAMSQAPRAAATGSQSSFRARYATASARRCSVSGEHRRREAKGLNDSTRRRYSVRFMPPRHRCLRLRAPPSFVADEFCPSTHRR